MLWTYVVITELFISRLLVTQCYKLFCELSSENIYCVLYIYITNILQLQCKTTWFLNFLEKKMFLISSACVNHFHQMLFSRSYIVSHSCEDGVCCEIQFSIDQYLFKKHLMGRHNGERYE